MSIFVLMVLGCLCLVVEDYASRFIAWMNRPRPSFRRARSYKFN